MRPEISPTRGHAALQRSLCSATRGVAAVAPPITSAPRPRPRLCVHPVGAVVAGRRRQTVDSRPQPFRPVTAGRNVQAVIVGTIADLSRATSSQYDDLRSRGGESPRRSTGDSRRAFASGCGRFGVSGRGRFIPCTRPLEARIDRPRRISRFVVGTGIQSTSSRVGYPDMTTVATSAARLNEGDR